MNDRKPTDLATICLYKDNIVYAQRNKPKAGRTKHMTKKEYNRRLKGKI